MSDCLWEDYQESGSWEDLMRWLKHRAYCRIQREEWGLKL